MLAELNIDRFLAWALLMSIMLSGVTTELAYYGRRYLDGIFGKS